MRKTWRHWHDRFMSLPHSLVLSIVTFAVAIAMTGALFLLTHDSLVICLLLLLPILLLSWISSYWAGLLVGFAAAVLIAPYYGPGASFISPPLPITIWGYLSACYIILGGLIGMQGSLLRQRQTRLYAEIAGKLQHAEDTTKQYEALLEEMSEGQDLLNRMNNELALLSTIATAVNSSLDLHQVQTTAMTHIGVLLHVEEIHFYWHNQTRDAFILQASSPELPDIHRLPPVDVNEGILGRVAHYLRVESISAETDDLHLRPPAMSSDIRSIMAIPLRAHARLAGVLVLGRREDTPFTEEDGIFLESIGRVLAVAVENARLFKQTQEMSLSDELTGLGNRRLFNLRLSAEMSRATVTGDPLSLAMLDLDHFKLVNDQYGHPAGDEVLRQFAERVQREIRSSDLFCRIGGEEFALVTNTPFPIALSIVDRICQHIAQIPFDLPNGETTSVTVSAGIASLQSDMQTPDTLVAAADRALYAAKNAGRNQVISYSSDIAVPATN